MSSYRTKTQKKRALESIHGKAFKLLGAGAISMNEFSKIQTICKAGLKKL